MEKIKAVWQNLRWVIVGLVVFWSFWNFFSTVRHVPDSHRIPLELFYENTKGEGEDIAVLVELQRLLFKLWYGNWRRVLIQTGVFTLFLVGFSRPRRWAEWRNAGLYTAFLISLFTEMFGIPLTIYLLAPLLGLPPWAFGRRESHLGAFALDWLGLLPLHLGVYLVMVVSIGLIAIGVSLVAVGWATVYRGQGQLVTDGIYRYLRHPQYLGLILIILAFNIQWPTLLTLLMAPVLIIMYVRLARREDEELAMFFGQAFLDYAARVPAFIPWGSERAINKVSSEVKVDFL